LILILRNNLKQKTMSKITALEPKTFQGKPNGFTVTFEDGRSGNLQEKESDKGLRVGDTVNVTEIPYTSKAGKQSTLYGVRLALAGTAQVLQSPQPPSPSKSTLPESTRHGWLGTKSVTDMRFEARLDVIELITRLVLAGKIELKEVKEYYAEWVDMVDITIDELK
jgi:hypothetical protein